MPKCPYCNKEMKELFDGEWECPKCGETFVDVGIFNFNNRFIMLK